MLGSIESRTHVYHYEMECVKGTTEVRRDNVGEYWKQHSCLSLSIQLHWKHHLDLYCQWLPMIKPQNHTNTSSFWQETIPDRNADETVPNVSDSHDFITDVYCCDLQGATKGWNLEIWKYSEYNTWSPAPVTIVRTPRHDFAAALGLNIKPLGCLFDQGIWSGSFLCKIYIDTSLLHILMKKGL